MQSPRFVFCFIVIFLMVFAAVTVIIFVRVNGVRIVKHFHEITLLTFGFFFFFWMIGELVRTSPGSLLVTLDDTEFDHFFGADNLMRIFVGVSFGET